MNFLSILTELLADSGFAALTWQSGVMILISFVLLYLAIVKKFEPLLLPITFGIFMSNLPESGTFYYFYNEVENWYDAGIIGVIGSAVAAGFFLIFFG